MWIYVKYTHFLSPQTRCWKSSNKETLRKAKVLANFLKIVGNIWNLIFWEALVVRSDPTLAIRFQNSGRTDGISPFEMAFLDP